MQPSIFSLLRIVSNSAAASFARAHGGQITVTQYDILHALSAQGWSARQGEAATAAKVDRSTTTAAVRRLIVSGYVSTRQDALDQRAVLITATQSGIELAARVRAEMGARERLFLSTLDAGKRVVLAETLATLAESVVGRGE